MKRLATGRADADAFEVEAEGTAVLVLRDRYARGWTAVVDGRPMPVLPANGLHRAVAVPSGRHAVRLAYRPPGLRLGMAAMTAGVAALAGVLIWPRLV